ncbi:MAG: sigma-54-dependent Fis family transcriptional regulator [Candidatus Coatesbacteria bacterium]|nr:sigma-54-dependent Fis family transcriptional regulator [Candidatus Coatesbacteria bacterium]
MSENTLGPLLLIDDDTYLLQKLREILEAIGYAVEPAQSRREALQMLAAKRYALVITDLSMPGTEGLSMFEAIRKADPIVPVIIVTGYGSAHEAALAMRMGCTDYLRKPVDPDELVFRIEKARHQSMMQAEVISLRAQISRSIVGQNIIGESASMQLIMDKITMAARSDITVLIRGETGTGKELVAKAIHNNSLRAKHPFVTVACGAIPQTLLEGELFGRRKGAYTGADRDQKGLIESAERGTLFLDEISEVDIASQVKLLRFLESGEVRPLGDIETSILNVRVVAASNLDMERAIERNLLREDLFYRLSVFTIALPPLRERKEDIPLLVKHFSELHGPVLCGKPKVFPPDTIRKLSDYDWPGNVRELENKVRQALLLTDGQVVGLRAVETSPATGMRSDRRFADVKRAAVEKAEKRFIREMLERTNGAIAEAAELAGLHRKNFSTLMKKYGIDASEFRKRNLTPDQDMRNRL